ncbi:MAG: hydantoinase/oxoprolinase family protein, partial [Rhodospirillaceae bacterium]|nr:hydantoinase/oxoprolinase family protein [Rhodospirillaceae bacterium]
MAYRLGIDIGGTFTDFALYDEAGGSLAIHKQLTTPDDPSRAVLEGTSAILARHKLDLGAVGEVVHGTTLVTNAVIERKGASTGMLTTRGFRDILDMRQEKRYDVFDLRLVFPDPIVPRRRRAEVDERCHYDGRVELPLDLDGAKAALVRLVEEQEIESLAICLLHAYANPAHELALGEMARETYPDLAVSLSSVVCPEWREFERFTTTAINAFTQPMFDQYLRRLESGLEALGFTGRLFVMSSSGGTLTPETARNFPVRVIESGPAAGAQMSAFHGRALDKGELLSFDMGGTTAKGALIRGGRAIKEYHQEVARVHGHKAGSGLPVRAPVIDMIEIGAGGGSIAGVDVRGAIGVGPHSAGADPGPACYGQGGAAATLTDANLILGYLDPEFFLGGEMSLDKSAAEEAIAETVAGPLDLSLARAAWGIHEIVDEDVARAFRIHASERGFDYRGSSMIAFGGSGPVHALGVARKLSIPRVIFPAAAGVMSALGLLASPLTFEVARTRQVFVEGLAEADFDATFAALEDEAKSPLAVERGAITVFRRLDMRYHGQG